MAETPETPTPSLAERDTGDLADDIEAWADVDASNLRSGSRVTSAEQLMGREPDLRAAAAQLRQLDRIKRNTLWDPEDIRGLCELGVAEADWVAAEGSDAAVDAAGTMRSMAAHLRRFANALEADDGA